MELSSTKIKEWRENPVLFAHDQFGVNPDKWQIDALNAFASKDPKKFRICLKACAGPGKSAVLSWCGWNFLSCYGEPNEHPKGAAISVTWDNLTDNLWVELAKWQNTSAYLKKAFTWQKQRIFANHHPETWFLSARSFPKSADPETMGKTLSGIHSKYVLFLIDESGDIPVPVGKAAEQAMGETIARGGVCKILQAGNPISTDGLLYHCSLSPNWYVITITGDPDDPNRSPRIDPTWAKQQIEEFGRDDPWVMSYILGLFPKNGLNTLLSIDEVEKAMKRSHKAEDYAYSQKRMGIDVARSGMDYTIIFPRQGLQAFNYVKMRNAIGPAISARILEGKRKWGSEMEYY